MQMNCPAQCHVKEKSKLADCLYKKPQVTIIPTIRANFIETARILEHGLCPYFDRVDVSVVECPDLSLKPFNLPKCGICGDSTITRIGSYDYLLPSVNQEKKYDLMDIIKASKIRAGMVLGGGTGPLTSGPCEMTISTNFCEDKSCCNRSMHGCVNKSSNSPCSHQAQDTMLSVQGQVFITEATEGKVIKILASRRRSCSSIGEIISLALKSKYGRGDVPMAMGFVFLLQNAGAYFNVLAEHPCEPYHTFPEMGNYYKHFVMPGPIIGVGSVISHDPGNFDFKLHETHVYNENRTMSGQFDNDADPDVASYHIYLSPATHICRMDKPIY